MRKLIILLCCGVLISMVGRGGNTAPPHNESLLITVSETAITDTPPVTAVEPTEKEAVSIASQEQTSEPTSTALLTTKKSTVDIKSPEATNTSENGTAEVVETVTSTTSQPAEIETTVAEPTKEIVSESEITQSEFDVQYWVLSAQEDAISVGLTLDSEAASCWDNPIGAGAHCIYLERDIKSRLNRYAKDEKITDVWIWAESASNDCYDIYIGYA